MYSESQIWYCLDKYGFSTDKSNSEKFRLSRKGIDMPDYLSRDTYRLSRNCHCYNSPIFPYLSLLIYLFNMRLFLKNGESYVVNLSILLDETTKLGSQRMMVKSFFLK